MENVFSPLEEIITVSPSGQDILGEPEMLKTCPWCLACCENYKDNNSTPDSPFHKPRDCEHLVTWLLLQFISLGCCWQEAWDNEPAITFKDFQNALAFVPFFWEYCERADLLDREEEREKNLELKRAADEERSILDHVNVLFINLLIDIWAVVQEYVEKMEDIASERRYKKDKRDREHSAARGKMNSEIQIYEDMVVRLLASIFEIFPQDNQKMHSKLVRTMENVRGVIHGQQLNDMFDLATEFIASLKKEVAALKPEPATPKPATTVPLAAAVKKLYLDPEGYEKVTRRRPKEEKEKNVYQRIFVPCRHGTKAACEAVDAEKVQKKKLDRRSRCCLNSHADDLKQCDRETRRYGCGCRCVNPNCRPPKRSLCSYDTGNGKPVLLKPGQTAECATMCCRGVHVKKNPDMIRVGKDSVIATPKNIEHAFALIEEESARRKAESARRKAESARRNADAETRRINRKKNPSHKKVTRVTRLEAATDHKRAKQKAKHQLRKKLEEAAFLQAINAAASLKARCDAAPNTTILTRYEKEMLWAAGHFDLVKKCEENADKLLCRLCFGRVAENGCCRICDPEEFQDEMGGGM